MTLRRMPVSVGLAVILAAVTRPGAAGADEPLVVKLNAFEKNLASAVGDKVPADVRAADAELLAAVFGPEGGAMKSAKQMKLLGNEPSDERVFALAASVWTNLRAGPKKADPFRPITRELVADSLADSVFVKFTCRAGAAEVRVNGVGQGATETERFLTKGKTYQVEFTYNGKQQRKSFTPRYHGDTCEADF